MFVKKTQAEIDKFSPEEADKYFAAKEAHEAEAHKAELDAMAEAMRKEFKNDLAAANKAVEEMTEQINQLKETAEGQAALQKGVFVAFAEKTILDAGLNKDNTKAPSNHSASLTFKAAALMTTANVVPNVAGGFSPLFGNYIDAEIGHTPKPENIFMQLVTVTSQPGTENIYFSDRINEEGTAAFIAEGATKPLADAEWKTTSLQTKEAAVRWKMTNRLMFHAPAVVQDFREHATELVEQVIDDAILDGDGTGNNLAGLISYAGTFVAPVGLAEFYTFANIYDVIAAMATQIKIANHKGQIDAVLNTVWWAKMAGEKNAEGDYLVVPFKSPDGKTIYDVRVHFTNKMDADKILVGVLKNYKLVVSENAIYSEGYENDDFSKNLVSKKIESFLNGYVKTSQEGSILYADIDDVLEDIEFVAP